MNLFVEIQCLFAKGILWLFLILRWIWWWFSK